MNSLAVSSTQVQRFTGQRKLTICWVYETEHARICSLYVTISQRINHNHSKIALGDDRVSTEVVRPCLTFLWVQTEFFQLLVWRKAPGVNSMCNESLWMKCISWSLLKFVSLLTCLEEPLSLNCDASRAKNWIVDHETAIFIWNLDSRGNLYPLCYLQYYWY